MSAGQEQRDVAVVDEQLAEVIDEEGDADLEDDADDRMTLAELTGGCDPDDPTDVPKAAELAAAMLRQVELIVMRHERVEETLDAFGFSFDWSEDADGHVEQQLALQLLAEAGELLDELRRGIFRWLKCVSRGPVLEFDDETVAAARKIAQLWGTARHWAANDAAAGAIRYAAGNAEALEAIKAQEDRRVESHTAEIKRLADRAEVALKSGTDDAGIEA